MVTTKHLAIVLVPLTSFVRGQTCTAIDPVNTAVFAPGYSGHVVVGGLKGIQPSIPFQVIY